jgi:hypothetical protein
MFLAEDISKTFNSSFSLENSEEKFESAIFTFLAYDISLPNETELADLFTKINSQDKIELQLNLGEATPIIFQSSKNTILEFINEIKNKQRFYTKGEKITLQLSLIKKGAHVSIYSIEAFIKFLNSLSLEQLLINFSYSISEKKYLVFECFDLRESFSTQTIYFVQAKTFNTFPTENSIKRDEILNKSRTNCSFTFSQPIILTPDDFYIVRDSCSNTELHEILDKILSVLLVTFLFDVTSLKNNTIIYKLNGYKSLAGTFDIIKPLNSFAEYYDVYKWIYNGGNLSDKFGLSRNIISLHLNAQSGLEINKSTYLSIISSYKVYEKQNVRQYIELRNRISDQIIGYNEKANKIIENFSSGFQKSGLAFISLFTTIILVRVLTTQNFTDIFTYDATLIALTFLIGSLIYFFISLWEVNAQLKRFKNSYFKMKNRNLDLLTSEDVQRILDNDVEHDDDVSFIKRKRKAYSILWSLFLLIFLLMVLLLHWEFHKDFPDKNSLFKFCSFIKIPFYCGRL